MFRRDPSSDAGPLGSETPTAPETRVVNSCVRASNFRYLLASAVSSAFGGAMSGVAVTWLVYHFTGSTLAVAYVGLTGFVPAIVFGLLAGVIADRYDRRRLMITSDLVRLGAMGVLVFVLFLTGFSLFLVLAVMTLVFSFTALFTPASQAILPRIATVEQLENANGLITASTQTAMTLGSGAGGLVLVFAGAIGGLSLNVATYALSALFLFQIAAEAGRIDSRKATSSRSFRSDFREGIDYMRTHRPVLEVTLGMVPLNFLFVMVVVFFVVYATTVFGSDPAVYGYIVAGTTAGTAVGALIVGRIRARRFAGVVIALSAVLMGGAIGVMAWGRTLPEALVGAASIGFCLGLLNTTYYSTMQAIVPNQLLARVLSIDSVASFVAIPAGLVVGGVLSSIHGILFTYSLAAVGIFVNGLVLLALPGVRSLKYAS